jgi:hypothetical protein
MTCRESFHPRQVTAADVSAFSCRGVYQKAKALPPDA